jgi:hypothetical protein
LRNGLERRSEVATRWMDIFDEKDMLEVGIVSTETVARKIKGAPNVELRRGMIPAFDGANFDGMRHLNLVCIVP